MVLEYYSKLSKSSWETLEINQQFKNCYYSGLIYKKNKNIFKKIQSHKNITGDEHVGRLQ